MCEYAQTGAVLLTDLYIVRARLLVIREDLFGLVQSSLGLLLASHNVLLILEVAGKLRVQGDRKVFDLICPANIGVCMKWLCEG